MLELLELAALLWRFDTAQLRVLADADEDAIEGFLANGWVEPVTDAPGRFRLQPQPRDAALARLRAERPADEVTLHRRAFDLLLLRVRDSTPKQRALADEDDCLYHLDRLFLLVGAQITWGDLLRWVAAMRAANPIQAHHHQRLALYEGYAAVYTRDYERGEVVLEALLAQSPAEADVRLKAIKGLADAAVMRAQHERARDLYERLRIAAEHEGDTTYLALALVNLGLVQYELGDHGLAMDYCERSLPLFRATGDRRREAHVLYHLALYSFYLGRWEATRSYGAAAAGLFENLGMAAFFGFVSWLRGVSAHYLGDLAESESAYLLTLELAEAPDLGQPSLAMDAHLQYGFLCQTQDRPDEAARHYEQALALAQRIDQRHRACLIRFRQGWLHREQGRLDEAFAALHGAIEGFEALRRATASEEIKIGLLGTVQQVYEAMVLLCLERGQTGEAFEYAERARQQAFLDALAQRADTLTEVFAQPAATLGEVQAALPADAVLLAYFTIGVLPRGEHLLNSLPAEQGDLRAYLAHPPQTLIFVVDRQRLELVHAPLDPNAIRPAVGMHIPGRRLLHGRLPEHLHACLIAPVAALLRDCATLYLVPHGPLHHVPFGALHPRGGDYLLHRDGPALAQAPSATVLLRSCLPGNAAAWSGGPAITLGFNDPDGDRPLRYAEAEAHLVAEFLGGTAATGAEATGERLLAAPAPAVLHFAGHARFDPLDPLGSGVRLADGLVSARDIIGQLRLTAGLVVLSACTSGTNRVVAGDELLGLQRALILAGARSVICTHWDANDLVALLVMDRFYRALLAGAAPAAALRDALVAVRSLTGADLVATADRWRGTSPALHTVADDLAAVATGALDAYPFADPFHWANFMLVGRA